jgi:hypothetical protein
MTNHLKKGEEITPETSIVPNTHETMSNVTFITVVFNLFSPRAPRDTFPLNFVPPKLLVHNSSYT